ncbi:MAG TPA: hypothetical protein VL335_00895 [Candidatus Paceibacterota bacterium]|jgi:hypothetical protein|nr:hypothetical protein [Candidatus Paceibacterota bacterium]
MITIANGHELVSARLTPLTNLKPLTHPYSIEHLERVQQPIHEFTYPDKHPIDLHVVNAPHYTITFTAGGHRKTSGTVCINFLSSLHSFIGPEPHRQLTKLRIISASYRNLDDVLLPLVFFEFERPGGCVISGETVSSVNGGQGEMELLKGIFDRLSRMFGVRIQEVTAGTPINLDELYMKRPLMAV